MNMTKTLILTLAGILMVALFLSLIQLLLRKLKTTAELDLQWKSSYGLWFTGLFASAAIIIAHALAFLAEAVDNIRKIGGAHQTMEIIKIFSLYIGLGISWYLLWYYITKVFGIILLGNRKENEELVLNNVTYFLIRAVIFAGTIFSLGFIFDLLLRLFMPNVPVTFYH